MLATRLLDGLCIGETYISRGTRLTPIGGN